MSVVGIGVGLAIIAIFFFLFRKKKKISDVTLKDETITELISKPIISYSIYTVDTQLNYRYLNYSNDIFPNYYGILKHQYIEIDWNVLNADKIMIEGIGIVKAVGRKAFYPTEATKYCITASNKEFTVSENIYIHLFPVSIADKLLTKKPTLNVKSTFILPQINTISFNPFAVNKPSLKINKPNIIEHKTLNNFINQRLSK